MSIEWFMVSMRVGTFRWRVGPAVRKPDAIHYFTSLEELATDRKWDFTKTDNGDIILRRQWKGKSGVYYQDPVTYSIEKVSLEVANASLLAGARTRFLLAVARAGGREEE